MMNDQELRLECLRLAEQNASNTPADLIVSKANAFYQFLVTDNQKQDLAQHRKGLQSKQDRLDEIDLTEQKQLVVVALTPELHALLSQLQG